MVTKTKSVTITFDRSGDTVYVDFIPRPGKAKDTPSGGWMRSFFTCDFKLDRERSVWVITTGFCFNASDRYAGGGEESDTPEETINFNEPDSDLPIMVWKPKKRSRAK